MTVFNYEADAERVYDVLKQGGISVIPSHVGYVIVACDPEAIVTAITEEWDLPMGTAGKVHMDHPAIAGLPEDTLAQTTHEGTLAMLLNAGPLMDKIARLAFADNRMAIGSSANVSLQGVKFRATEIEPEILEAADIVIDYGLMRWNLYGHSSTMINVSDMTVIRYGSCFDLIEDLLRTHFDIELPPNPYDED